MGPVIFFTSACAAACPVRRLRRDHPDRL